MVSSAANFDLLSEKLGLFLAALLVELIEVSLFAWVVAHPVIYVLFVRVYSFGAIYY
jgi:hypothetical protein